jgi:hypothetical protein
MAIIGRSWFSDPIENRYLNKSDEEEAQDIN